MKAAIDTEKKYLGIEIFDSIERAIFVGAHPDDIEGCAGGTLRRLVLQGVDVFVVNCTSGDIGTQDSKLSRIALAEIRKQEAMNAAQLLGVTEVFMLDYPDGELEPSLELRADLAKLYRTTQADALFTFDPHWPDELHPDHRAAGRAAIDAITPSRMPLYRPEHLAKCVRLGNIRNVFLFYPERASTIDVIVDISNEYRIKEEALLAHASQFPDTEEVCSWLRAWNQDTGSLIDVSFAEGFRMLYPKVV